MPAGVVERRSFYFLHMIMTAGDRGKTWPDGVTYHGITLPMAAPWARALRDMVTQDMLTAAKKHN